MLFLRFGGGLEYCRAMGGSARTQRMTRWFENFQKTCIISDMRTSEAVRQVIAAKPDGAVFSAADLRLAGNRAAIDQALKIRTPSQVFEMFKLAA